MSEPNWTTITGSRYPWEQDALDFIREQFPSHEPYRAWANFEFGNVLNRAAVGAFWFG